MKPRTKRQIDRLIIDREKPLFISDADEVVLYFAKHFKSFLESRGWNSEKDMKCSDDYSLMYPPK